MQYVRHKRERTEWDALSGLDAVVLVAIMALSFLPYLSLGPLSVPSQVQPWAAIGAWIWLALRLLSGRLRIAPTQMILLWFALWFLVYVYDGSGLGHADSLRRSSGYILGIGIAVASAHITPKILWRALGLVVPTWLGFGLLRYGVPALYYTLVEPLVPTVFHGDARGTSSLAPEATDFGFTMVFLVVLGMIARRRLTETGVEVSRWPIVLAAASAILSVSGTGFFGLAAVGAVFLLTRPPGRGGIVGRRFQFVAALIAGLLVLGTLPVATFRGLALLQTAVEDPSGLLQSTLVYRVAHNLVGVIGFAESGLLGYGAGSFTVMGPTIYSEHGIGGLLGITGYYASNVPLTLGQSPVSAIAPMLLEYGMLGLIFALIVFRIVVTSDLPYKSIAVLILALAWLQSFPVAWPPFWVLVGIAMSRGFGDPSGTRMFGADVSRGWKGL